jgi:hypothetical protein
MLVDLPAERVEGLLELLREKEREKAELRRRRASPGRGGALDR